MWRLESELVVPATLAGAIDERVAEALDTKVIVEAANSPPKLSSRTRTSSAGRPPCA